MPTANKTYFQLVKKSVHPVNFRIGSAKQISYYSVKVEERFDSVISVN